MLLYFLRKHLLVYVRYDPKFIITINKIKTGVDFSDYLSPDKKIKEMEPIKNIIKGNNVC